MRANARIIAAAPELLEALRKLCYQERGEAGMYPSPLHLEAEALIARIENP